MIAAALRAAISAGVSSAQIARVIAEEEALDDDLTAPIIAGRLAGLAKRRRLPPRESPVLARPSDDW